MLNSQTLVVLETRSAEERTVPWLEYRHRGLWESPGWKDRVPEYPKQVSEWVKPLVPHGSMLENYWLTLFYTVTHFQGLREKKKI